LNRMNPQPSAQNFMKCPGERRLFKIATRFGDEDVDVIDEEVVEDPERDDDNPENPSLQHASLDSSDNSASSGVDHLMILSIMLATIFFSKCI
jgi:hypothetical protein